MIDTNAVLGYAWPLVVSPGDELAFHLSSPELRNYDATVVRVRCADPDPNGPGLKMHVPGTPLDGPLAVPDQPLYPGSCAVIADSSVLASLESFTAGAFIWPTLLDGRAQTLLSRWRDDIQEGWRLGDGLNLPSAPTKHSIASPPHCRCCRASGRWLAGLGMPLGASCMCGCAVLIRNPGAIAAALLRPKARAQRAGPQARL